MTRYIDDLDHGSGRPAPTPTEVNAIIEEARVMRSRAYGEAFAWLGRAVGAGFGALLRPAGRRTRGPITLLLDLMRSRGAARG
ncbi:MAG: hypothetical protein AAGE83_16885 [Pseudomonadota bacterium]